MTTYEHAMLGITGVLAAGLHRRCGWPIAALAAVAATSPDWDGLTIVAGSEAFAASHRLWGHNVLVCVLSGLLLGILDYQFDVTTRCGRFLVRKLRLVVPRGLPQARETHCLSGFAVWVGVAILAALSHLAGDLVFSGTATLPDWELRPWWPFSSTGCLSLGGLGRRGRIHRLCGRDACDVEMAPPSAVDLGGHAGVCHPLRGPSRDLAVALTAAGFALLRTAF